MSAEVLTWLALLEMLGKGGTPPSGPPGPPGPPGSEPATPADFKIPPPGDIGPPPPGFTPLGPPMPPGTLPPMPPWPSPPTPGTLPPFPGPGWCPDLPVTATLSTRAAFWSPQLWDYTSKTIRKAFVQEQFGGSWVTFAAAWHPGSAGPKTYMATEAWRVCAAPPVAPPTPAPVPPSPAVPMSKPGPVGPEPGLGTWQTNAPYIARYQSALTWLARAGGPTTWDPQGVDGKYGPHTAAAVKAFQSGHGLTVDGKCGSQTAAALDAAMGYGAPGPYPTPGPSPAPAGKPAPVGHYPGPNAWKTNRAFIARYQAVLAYLSHVVSFSYDLGAVDGKYGPNTASAVKAFQHDHGLTPDGSVGPQTGAALDAALASAP